MSVSGTSEDHAAPWLDMPSLALRRLSGLTHLPAEHALSRHDHSHSGAGWRTTLLVGMMHGAAGSAALVALAGSTADSLVLGVVFIGLFGAGSIAGMAALSAVIAVPLSWAGGSLTWINRILQATAGAAAVVIGALIFLESGAVLAQAV